ncbi:hypothetical protein ACEQ8H_002623 [Pleosporales sp. CAS-2024a]
MAPPSYASASGSQRRESSSHEYDAIDLTLSSPEPEQQRRLPQQQRVHSYFKGEPGSSSRQNGTGQNPSRAHSRAVDPEHLAKIVKSTDYQVVEEVLLDLCLQSPALSGAVARALAPHSTFAQSLITTYLPGSQRSSGRPLVKTEYCDDGEDARQRMKQRLAVTNAASGSRPSQVQTLSTQAGSQSLRRIQSESARATNSQSLRTNGKQPMYSIGSQSAPRFKRGRTPETEEEPDSDLDQYIPRDFPITPARLPTREEQGSFGLTPTYSSSHTRVPMQSHKAESPEPAPKRCLNCREMIDTVDEDGLCFYHPGPFRNLSGRPMCGSCNKGVHVPACHMGTHAFTGTTGLDARKRHSSNRSQSPSKRLRIV